MMKNKKVIIFDFYYRNWKLILWENKGISFYFHIKKIYKEKRI